MLDAIRQRQIDESLNDIRDFNAMVFNIERRNSSLNPDNVLPYTQLNPEAIETTSVQVQQLLPLLERKRAAMAELQHVPVGMRREFSHGGSGGHQHSGGDPALQRPGANNPHRDPQPASANLPGAHQAAEESAATR